MAIDNICQQAEQAVDKGTNFIILSDRGISEDLAPIPSLLTVSAVHHHLIFAKKRMQVGLIVESAEPREVNHFALLFGFGASVVNPYGAYAMIEKLCQSGAIKDDYVTAREHFIKAVDKGLLKVMSKMGISTLRSYHGAQIFEAIGLSQDVSEKFFGIESRIGGIGLEEIAREALMSHQSAYNPDIQDNHDLALGFVHFKSKISWARSSME